MTPLSQFISRFVPLSRRLRRASRCAVVALVLVAALTMSSGLAACSGAGAAAGATASGAAGASGGSARPTGSVVASPSPSAQPTLSPELAALREEALGTEAPEAPAVMSEDSPEGAATTALYFLSLYRYTFLTGDTKPIAAISDSECVFCTSTIDDARVIAESGGWGEPWTQQFGEIGVHEGDDAEGTIVRVEMSFGEIVQHDASGAVVRTSPPEDSTIWLRLLFDGTGWRVVGVEVDD